jgi:hypothetical protein
MELSGWIIFGISQIAPTICIFLWIFGFDAITFADKHYSSYSLFFFFTLPSIALILLDIFFITGVVGSGWPVPVGASAALLVLGSAVLLSVPLVDSGKPGPKFLSFVVIIIGVAIFVLILHNVHWPSAIAGHHVVAGPSPRTTPTPSSSPTTSAGSPAARPDWLLIWTTVGGLGSLLGGCAAFVAVLRNRI